MYCCLECIVVKLAWLLAIERKVMLDKCSFPLDNNCFVRVQQITGLVEKIIHQNSCGL